MRRGANLIAHLDDDIAPKCVLSIGRGLGTFLIVVDKGVAGHLACGGHNRG